MAESSAAAAAPLAPHPGSQRMPRWNVGELPEAPRVTWRTLALLLGPGLVSGGAAIGGGEWLLGPLVTARYGGAMLWLATLSILGQVVYNFEISRYTLYSGEPIFTGKFRTLPGPKFWLVAYLFLDFGSLLPYAAANAAPPLFAVLFGRLPVPNSTAITSVFLWMDFTDKDILRTFGILLFLGALLPLIFGGKVYNSLKAVMTFKVIAVLGFLTIVAVLYSEPSTWRDILSGFVKFGSIPVSTPDPAGGNPIVSTDNVFLALWEGRSMPQLDWSVVALLAAMAAISGSGGLTNTAVSGYTRDQGWGMGVHVGAIPSAIGGHKFSLSHMGTVFRMTTDSLRRWRGWLRHVARDQLIVWMPACFIGIALPSMLSVQFLPRGTKEDGWNAAVMTANGVRDSVTPGWGGFFWYCTILCGFLILSTTMVTTADGVLRRWVDVFWTGSPRLQKWDAKGIRKLYFLVLCCYATLGTIAMAFIGVPESLLKWAGNIYNYALGFSCLHALYINTALLPKELRPGWFNRVGLVLAGGFFTIIAIMATLDLLKVFEAAK
ncbi:MAG: Nramp family divalent metal transporter [Pirellulales bacterium]